MNVTFDLEKLKQRRSKFTEAQLDAFHREAVLRAARGLGDKREGAYPMLTPGESMSKGVIDPVRQTMAIIRDFHPGKAWNDPEFVDTVQAALEARYAAMRVAALPAAPEVKKLGNRFGDAPGIGWPDAK